MGELLIGLWRGGGKYMGDGGCASKHVFSRTHRLEAVSRVDCHRAMSNLERGHEKLPSCGG